MKMNQSFTYFIVNYHKTITTQIQQKYGILLFVLIQIAAWCFKMGDIVNILNLSKEKYIKIKTYIT